MLSTTIREIEVETTMRNPLTLVRTAISNSLLIQTINVTESVEERKPFYTVEGNLNRYGHYGDVL